MALLLRYLRLLGRLLSAFARNLTTGFVGIVNVFSVMSFMNDVSGMTVSPAKLGFGKAEAIVVEPSSQSLDVINNRGESDHPLV